ncbi:MAG: hypothetical protein EOP54_07515 [Sphingobacteriales bacterium]|nr:MAG: hypothetical protein EOP54_07515 [Sphingobacteriales bacterium]
MRLIGWIMLIIFVGSCKQISGSSPGLYQEAAMASKALGTVSVPIYSSIGVKSPKKIRCQLVVEARKMFPQCKGISNVRYVRHSAYAEVMH